MTITVTPFFYSDCTEAIVEDSVRSAHSGPSQRFLRGLPTTCLRRAPPPARVRGWTRLHNCLLPICADKSDGFEQIGVPAKCSVWPCRWRWWGFIGRFGPGIPMICFSGGSSEGYWGFRIAGEQKRNNIPVPFCQCTVVQEQARWAKCPEGRRQSFQMRYKFPCV